MTGHGASMGPLRFSTDALPERDRLAIWYDVFGRQIVKTEIEPPPDRPFFQSATLYGLPGLSLSFVQCNGFHSRRTRALIGDGNDDLLLVINVEGTGRALQLGREATCTTGEAVLLTSAEVGALQVPGRARIVTIGVPRKTVVAMVIDPEAAVGRAMKPSNALRLLSGYLGAAEDRGVLTEPELQAVFATHVQDLVAHLIGATRDGVELVNGRGVRAARLQAIRVDIRAHLGALDLSLDAVAERQGISAIYVRKLLEGEDTSFTKYVLEQRLRRAHRMLRDPRFAGRSIAAIATDAGFGDLSYFNRAFRRRYGASPSDARAQATP
jgi:AraC-like DNA-binding protein